MGHRDLLVTHNLSEDQNNEPRSYLRGSVRRASGFVLTGEQEVIGCWSALADDFRTFLLLALIVMN